MATGVHKKYPPMKEKNKGWKGAKTGTKVKEISGPAVGHVAKVPNPIKGGGINRKTKGKMAGRKS